jgi:hypothetical protein
MERVRRCFGITGNIRNLNFDLCRRRGNWWFYCYDHWKQPIYLLIVCVLFIVGKVADFSAVINLFKPPIATQEPSLTTELKQTQIAPPPLLDFRFKNEKIKQYLRQNG